MVIARDVANALEEIAPIDSGIPDDELGFVYGDPEKTVVGVGCAWNVHTRSIEACAAQGLDMMICHESIWMPAQESPWYDGPEASEVFSNRVRRELLDRHGIVVYRSHSNWDALQRDGVPDQAVAALGIDGLREVGRQRFFTVNELPKPQTVAQLRSTVARGLGYDDCRIFGDPEQAILRFAFLIGGFGENQYHMPQAARDLGAEALIIGEMSEFIVISALEMGLPVIESLHSASESPAIRRQAELLAAKLPDLPVRYVPSGARAFGTQRM
ncbi:MAG: Nif3-like dinuclear metal center hexameric protein [Anaerolineae bacterium]